MLASSPISIYLIKKELCGLGGIDSTPELISIMTFPLALIALVLGGKLNYTRVKPRTFYDWEKRSMLKL